MMQQPSMRRRHTFPGRLEIFFHSIKTTRLIATLFKDRRIAVLRKVGFVLAIVILLAILAFPDTLGELGLSAVLPVVGTVLGIPIDAGFDWAVFALAAVNLLRIFPADLVAEHYEDIFQ